jgi:RNA polymerase sigma factor (sigma-70 family)
MATLQAGSILRQLRRVAFHPDGAGLTDGQLLRSFLDRRDEAAFEALVRRHGPMVRGVCRRILRNSHDIDDAFQAAFLVLVRKANGLAAREVVGDWLHGVAYRVALKARAADALRRVKERQVPRREAAEADERPEWLALLDQEVGRLPEKYRLPVVLCDLEGHTRKEAARQLGWPAGTLSGRLARARALLARRLTRRGVTLSGAALASPLTAEAVASVPISLVHSTSRAASVFAAGQTAGGISVQVAALTEGVVKAMLLTKFKPMLMLLMVVLAVSIGVGAWRHAATAGQAEEPQKDKPVPTTREERKVPVIPVANRSFQIDLTMTEVKDGHRKLMATPRLLTLDGREASFLTGGERPVPVGVGNIEFINMGQSVHLMVRSDEGGKICLDMTVSQPTQGVFAVDDVTVETKSVRIIRKVELGQPITAKLKTGDKDQTVREVTAAVTVADANGTIAAAEKDLKVAEFYRQTGHPDSACFYYEIVRRRYPNTIYAERARERLGELRKQQDRAADGEEKPQLRVGQIFIIGNTRTRMNVILRQVPLFPGQVFTSSDLSSAECNLSQLKGVKNAKVTAIESEDGRAIKDIRIEVEEK